MEEIYSFFSSSFPRFRDPMEGILKLKNAFFL